MRLRFTCTLKTADGQVWLDVNKYDGDNQPLFQEGIPLSRVEFAKLTTDAAGDFSEEQEFYVDITPVT